MPMFNECLIHLCDCTWLNVLHLLNLMLIKHKKIFNCFNCCWKVFCFKKFQKLCNFVLVTLPCESSQSRAYTEALDDSLVGQGPSRKKDLEKFQKSRFLAFSRLRLATCSGVEAPVVSLTQNGSRLPSRLTLGWTSSREKHLDKFFKICHTGFWQLDLVTCLRLIPVTKNVCFALWGLFSGQFSKKIFIFPSLIVTVHCLVRSFPFQTHRVLSKNPSFSSQSLHKSSRKGMGFLFFSKYFMFLALDFLDFVFLFEIWKYDVEYGLWMKVQIVCKTPMNV